MGRVPGGENMIYEAGDAGVEESNEAETEKVVSEEEAVEY